MPVTSQHGPMSPTTALITALVLTSLIVPQILTAADAISASTRQAADDVVSLLGSGDADLRAVCSTRSATA